ncbi:unnamed protein product, partial [Phaeothamnion confervicola]
DVLLCADCIYEPLYGQSWRALLRTICVAAGERTLVLVSVERRTADGVNNFLA